MTIQQILIIGAGQCGGMAAAALRQRGYSGRILLVGRETHLPYERPPLSKSALTEATDSFGGLHKDDFYSQNDIELRLGTTVLALDPQARTASLSDGSQVHWDRCLFATGGQPRELEKFPAEQPNVHYLRTANDAMKLRNTLKNSEGRLLIIGAGFLGLEVASTARSMGIEVTQLESGQHLLKRALPTEISIWLEERARNFGVDLRLATGVLDENSSEPGLYHLSDGTDLRASAVLVAAGMRPETTMAKDIGLEMSADGGIAVDANCETSVPGIFAAGDCATQLVAHSGQPMRLESWQYANEQARIAAAAMVGEEDAPIPLPWFWSDQFGCNLQMLGLPEPDLTYVHRNINTSSEAPKWVSFGLRNNQIRHVVCANAGGELRPLKSLMELGVACSPEALADVNQPLRQLEKQYRAAIQPANSAL
ncbi:NAD(P)/FAD-dependent oxidoreductase [Pseudomonas veronii]|uniref:NAD(P)/FAD-dependent oxidoreductase n=1 Tax=Pseudomonas veronii TaxID=76761 RepID=UPI002D765669|nr:FAD-dependent oxidoreductase [Pseudomonas veronii]WRU61172.1 FAD-dependent oxidoreductase [Pseudomonas veronii]